MFQPKAGPIPTRNTGRPARASIDPTCRRCNLAVALGPGMKADHGTASSRYRAGSGVRRRRLLRLQSLRRARRGRYSRPCAGHSAPGLAYRWGVVPPLLSDEPTALRLALGHAGIVGKWPPSNGGRDATSVRYFHCDAALPADARSGAARRHTCRSAATGDDLSSFRGCSRDVPMPMSEIGGAVVGPPPFSQSSLKPFYGRRYVIPVPHTRRSTDDAGGCVSRTFPVPARPS
jgi:hypothetical protein